MKTAIVHNQCMPYRRFLFKRLAEKFDIDFFFFNQGIENIPKLCKSTVLKGYKIPEFSDYWVVPGLKKVISNRKYDLIIGGDLGAYNTGVAYKVAKKTKTPFVPWILEWNYILHPRRALRESFENTLLSDASAILSPGKNHKEFLESRSVSANKIRYLPNCLDIKPSEVNLDHPFAKELVKIAQHHQIVSSIGRHIDIKGHEQLIEAQAELERKEPQKKSFLIIAGEGPLLRQNKNLAESLNLKKCKFIDHFVDSEEKRILFKFSNVFVLSSTRKRAFEAWGLVCNEAAYHGLPIIVSDAVGCHGEVVRHNENGFVFKDGQISQLVKFLSILLGNPEINERFRIKSKEISKLYLPNVMVDNFSQLIESFSH